MAEQETKWCAKCSRDRPIDEFGINRARYDGRKPYCLSCQAEYDKAHRKPRPRKEKPPPEPPPTTLVCTKCGWEGPLEEFPDEPRGKWGKRKQCQSCRTKAQAAAVAKRGPRPVSVEKKTCARCGQEKVAKAFSPDNRQPDGLQSTCLECYAKADVARRATDPEYRERKNASTAASHALYGAIYNARARERQAHRTPEQIEADRAYDQAYYEAYKDVLNELGLQRYWADPVAARRSAMDRYYAKLEENRARARRYAAEHRKEAAERTRAWILANPDKVSANALRRLEREIAALVDDLLVSDIGERDNWICHICGKKVDPALFWRRDPMGGTKDHLIPVTEDGLTEWRNLQLAHWACNRRRHLGRQDPTQLLLLGQFGELTDPSPPAA